MALGLEYLHSLEPNVIHGDLKGVSLLVIKYERLSLNLPSRPMFSLRNRAELAWLTSALRGRSIQIRCLWRKIRPLNREGR